MLIRPATLADVPQITAIYREQVQHGTASWEYDPPDEAEMANRMRGLLDKGFPYLVAVDDTGVTGYSYASSYRPRIGYRFVVEDSIYVRADQRGKGIGKQLLPTLIDACTARGYRQMLAIIGDSENIGSIRLHEACGFQHAGRFNAIGYKFDRWLDSVQMQRGLGQGVTG
jgi:L-amino acid N-acyltransferase YncA